MKKSKILVVALAVCLVAILSMGTLAWFSDSDAVENKFMIATSDDDNPDDIFSIDVWEDVPGKIAEQAGHTYEDILPGDSLEKTVFVKNTGYYDQYVRVIVTISDLNAWKGLFPANMTPEESAAAAASIFKGLDMNMWGHVYNNLSEDPNAEELIYVLYYKDVVKSSDAAIKVFDSIEIPTSMTQAQAAAFDNEFTITVRAQAVQTQNVLPETPTAGKTDAWDAFNTIGLGINN